MFCKDGEKILLIAWASLIFLEFYLGLHCFTSFSLSVADLIFQDDHGSMSHHIICPLTLPLPWPGLTSLTLSLWDGVGPGPASNASHGRGDPVPRQQSGRFCFWLLVCPRHLRRADPWAHLAVIWWLCGESVSREIPVEEGAPRHPPGVPGPPGGSSPAQLMFPRSGWALCKFMTHNIGRKTGKLGRGWGQ